MLRYSGPMRTYTENGAGRVCVKARAKKLAIKQSRTGNRKLIIIEKIGGLCVTCFCVK